MRSILKWPGGKRWLAGRLVPEINRNLDDDGIYYEPFLGGGAVFFALLAANAQLSDTNELLITSLATIRDRPDEVLHRLWRLSNTEECYVRVRKAKPHSDVGRAVRFLYLNRTAWGGIYRENAFGEFNVPFGASGRRIMNRKHFMACADALAEVDLRVASFEDAFALAGQGDVVYADPPYVQSEMAGEVIFSRYSSERFGPSEEKALTYAAEDAGRRGAAVFVSAFWTIRTERLWEGWWISRVSRPSNVSRKVEARRMIDEIIISNVRPDAFDGESFQL